MDLSKHLEKAEDAIRRKNFDYGIDLYRQLLSVSPGDHNARLGLHRAYMRKQESKATPMWAAKIQGGPALAMAKTFAAARNFVKEAEALEGYLALDPSNVGVSLEQGHALERANLLDGALAVYEGLAEAAPASSEAWKRAGAILTKKREIARALDCYTKALEINPRDQDSIKARKDLAAEGALLTSGLETGVHSRELIKDKERAADLERGQRLLHTADEIDAEVGRLTADLQKDPNNTALLKQLAGLHERKNDPAAALELVERALAQDPNDFDLKTRRGSLKSRILDRAIELLRGKVASDPAAAAALANAEREKLGFEVEDARARAAEHPTDLSLRYKLGRLLLKQGEIDEALGELQRAVVDPRVKTDALVGLGQAFFKKGMFDLARRQLERALESIPAGSPRSKEILYNLGLVAEKGGAPKDALGFYLRIYEVDVAYRDISDKVKKLQSAG
jgi:tetratricopeptide (TPR) repeat protein